MKNSSVQDVCGKDTHFHQPRVVAYGDIFTVSDLSIYVWFSNSQGVSSMLTTCEKPPVKNGESMGMSFSMDYLSQVEQLLKALFFISVLEVWSLFSMNLLYNSSQ